MKLKEIKKELEECNEIDHWRIIKSKITKKNIYVVKDFDVENILEGKREDTSVRVYKEFSDELGDNEFPVTGDEPELKKQLKDAVFVCSLSKKKKYSLPENQIITYSQKLWDDSLAEMSHNKLLELVALFKTEVKKHKGIILNSMEIHTSTIATHVVNSNNVDLLSKRTRLFVEFIISKSIKDGNLKKEQEFVSSESFSRLQDLDIAGFVNHKVKIVEDVLKAEKPQTFAGNILLSEDAVHDFFAPHLSLGPLLLHCSARMKYMDLTSYTLGKSLGNFKGDTLTVNTNPYLDFNLGSSLFDTDGVVSKPTLLIENGIFKNYFSSKQYADYLGIEATGSIGVLEITPGEKSETELRRNNEYVEIVSFASFVPDSISGGFSAEIRLGYLVKNGIKTPFRGGMF